MPKGFFSRVISGMSFSTLQIKARNQYELGLNPIEYIVIDSIFFKAIEFETVLLDISVPVSQYGANYSSSITSQSGIWNCIEFKCLHDPRSLIVYTAGRTLPLYAAPQ